MSRRGFFQLTRKNDKWWMLDPEGQPFHLRGLNHTGDGTYMPWNLKERYGDAAGWRRSVRDRHRQWGFTFIPPSIGPSAVNPDIIQGEPQPRDLTKRTPEWPAAAFADLDYPFTVFLEVPWQNISYYPMPDIFSDEFREKVDQRCRELVAPLRDNPNLIGYHFCHNPPWHPQLPGFERWIEGTTCPGSAGRREWMLLMRRIYGSIDRWQLTYGVPIRAWEEIEQLHRPLHGNISYGRMLQDKLAFMQRICEQWYRVYSETIRQYDPNHLLLGDRNTLHGAPLPPWAVRIMGRYVDVISVNVMGPPVAVYAVLEQVSRHWDGPIHLADSGTGFYEGEPTGDEADIRDPGAFETAYRGLMELGLDHPQVIGFGWCGYYHTPPPSCRTGIVDCRTDEPLAECLSVVEKWNAWMSGNYGA